MKGRKGNIKTEQNLRQLMATLKNNPCCSVQSFFKWRMSLF